MKVIIAEDLIGVFPIYGARKEKEEGSKATNHY